MSIKWRIGILLLIASLAGVCAFFVLNTGIPSPHESWNKKTTEKIGYSHAPEGGYADFAPNDPDLYSTYYFSLALKNNHIDLMQKEQTDLWLYSRERELIANPSQVTLKDLYYLTGCMKNYDILPENRSGIMSLVEQYSQPDGSYADRPGLEGSSLDTIRALEILDFIGNNTGNMDITREWLARQYQYDQISEDEDYLLTETQVLLPVSHLTGIDPDLEGSTRLQKSIEERYAGKWKSELEALPGKKPDLFTLKALETEVRFSGKLTPEISQKIQDYVYSLELPDGGYNAILGDYGESQGTYLAMKLLSDIGSPVHDTTIEFIRRHESRYGGFRPAFKITPSLKDTFYATQVLTRLDPHNPAIPAVKPWLDARMADPSLSPEDQYYLVMTYHELGESVPQAATLRNIPEQQITTYSISPDQLGDLEQVFYLLKMVKATDHPLDSAQRDSIIRKINQFQNSDGGYGYGGSDLASTYYALGSLDTLSASPDNPEACISWIEQGYAGDGGYYYRRGDQSTNFSYITPTYMSVSSLNYLHRYPGNAKTTLQWIDSSRYSDGGIQLMPEKPDTEVNDATFREKLEYTIQGLETEQILLHRTGI